MNNSHSDEMWLIQEKAKQKLGSKVFYLETTIENDVTYRIRKEILNFFGAKISSMKDKADVLLVIDNKADINRDGFELIVEKDKMEIVSANPVGILYGIYHILRELSCKRKIKSLRSIPTSSYRMINHWDNFDGTIERGYAGKSFFYKNNQFTDDIDKITRYARYLASIGINSIAINNVNVKKEEMHFLVEPYLNHIKLLNNLFAQFGIKTFLSINFASPIEVGGLQTADPFNEEVKSWWQMVIDNIYEKVPTFGGFLVKADSEGEPGPNDYDRSQADGANMFADALDKHNGTLIWRAFVYNCKQNWRDRKTDRAKASYKVFMDLDGQFKKNVILQIKFGPCDFQVGEPPHPLFGKLKHTNEMIEFQITQEYTGQQIDLNYLAAQWQEILDFNTDSSKQKRKLKYVIESDSPVKRNSGFAAVTNTGTDQNWTGNKLMQSNLYAFGRLAWNYSLDSKKILVEWIQQTFYYLTKEEQGIIFSILSSSNETYEKYTSPLGIGWMVNSKNEHYGPGLNDHEYSKWGTYHFSDRNGLGVDRTVKSGSGYTAQYSEAAFKMFENIKTCPERYLLFFHHVSYNHELSDGRTVIQYIYDVHFEGVEMVKKYINQWNKLKGKVKATDYENVCNRLQMQLKNAIEWRDQVNTFYLRFSGIKDYKGKYINP